MRRKAINVLNCYRIDPFIEAAVISLSLVMRNKLEISMLVDLSDLFPLIILYIMINIHETFYMSNVTFSFISIHIFISNIFSVDLFNGDY